MKKYIFFNIFFFFILNYSVLFQKNEIFAYIFFLILLYFSNKSTIYIILICFLVKYDNLLINLIQLELINLIFLTQCNKNYNNIKNIIIFNYYITTFFIFVTMFYFYNNYSTLNKEILMYFDPKALNIFLLTYLFFKMGGIFGYKNQIFFYKYLNFENLIVYNIANFYLYFYIFNIENLIFFKNNFFIFFLLILNSIIIFFNIDKFNSKRDFLFLSSQFLLSNIFLFLFF